MNQIITTVAWSAPITAVLLTALVFLVRSWFGERLRGSIRNEYAKELAQHTAKIRLQMDLDLEEYKSKLRVLADFNLEERRAALKSAADLELEIKREVLQRLGHVNKAQFDLELSGFQKLWSAVSEMLELTFRALKLYDFRETVVGKGHKKESALAADGTVLAALRTIQDLRPFIPSDIHQLASSLGDKAKHEIDILLEAIDREARNPKSYAQDQEELLRESRGAMTSLASGWRELADGIRQRLRQLSEL